LTNSKLHPSPISITQDNHRFQLLSKLYCENMQKIVLKKVCVHNLKNIDLELDPNQFIVFTGVSGSGKSSLAFDTIYAEGQRKYIESLSSQVRRHLENFPKPQAERISGISPTIAIEQKSISHNPRSTVGTMTSIYDFLRVLFARAGMPHCPISGEAVSPQSSAQIIETIERLPQGTKLLILAPYAKGKKGEFKDDLSELLRHGFMRIRLDGTVIEISGNPTIDKQKPHDVDVVIDRITLPAGDRLKESITTALTLGKGVMTIYNVDSQEETLFSRHAHAFTSGISYPPLEPQDFSFNHPLGMCPTCQGLGIAKSFDLELIIDPNKSIEQDLCCIAPSYTTVRYGNIYNNLAKLYDFSVQTPWKNLSQQAKDIFLYGTDKKWIKMKFIHPRKKTNWVEFVRWKGVIPDAWDRYTQASSPIYQHHMQQWMQQSICPSCKGSRLKPYPSAARFEGKTITEITSLSIQDALDFFQGVERNRITEELLKEIIERLHFLIGVGLEYLTLNRTAPTISGGESQRVRLACQIGYGLVGTTYILDEPSIGLHPIDNKKLLKTLRTLCNKGNTLIVVEHDAETIFAADYIVDIGPLAGRLGGRVVYAGEVSGLLHCEESITGKYLSKKIEIKSSRKRRVEKEKALIIKKAAHHNLQSIDVTIPLGVFIAMTGVSGSGKSSLITEIIYPAISNQLHKSKLPVGKHQSIEGVDFIDKIITIDQDPIGKTPRSNPATYIKLFDDIRDLYSQLPTSVALGYKAGRFSFNVKEGSCPSCIGMGVVKLDMDFLEEAFVLCPQCKGSRFDEKTLAILYKGKNIHDVLEMTVEEALDFFSEIPQIKKKLTTLHDVGLGYIKVGQSSSTLSGGESQRIKLAKELSRPQTKKTLYLLDEPTTGLHFHDIAKLIDILQSLVDSGNTVLVIEHNIDLIKATDWIIELGPKGGSQGGLLIAEGTPEELAAQATATGKFLQETFVESTIATPSKPAQNIEIVKACQNNLKCISAIIPRGKITICTGPSGSGKSSLAFETVYAEGQRRYVESMSTFARQFITQMEKPKVESINGLSPAIAIEQKNSAGNPRSTIGTLTEIYDFLKILYAYLGTPFSPETGQELKTITKESVVDKLLSLKPQTRLHILSPMPLTIPLKELAGKLQRQGYLRIRINQTYYELDEELPNLKVGQKNSIFLVVDRCLVSPENRMRLLDAIETASKQGSLIVDAEGTDLFFNLNFTDPTTGKAYPTITPHTFSFNTEEGMCSECLGLGFLYGIDPDSELLKKTPLQLVCFFWQGKGSEKSRLLMRKMVTEYGIDCDKPLHTLPKEKLALFLQGPMESAPFRWLGLNAVLNKASKMRGDFRDAFAPFLQKTPCIACQGSRLNPLARCVKIHNLSIADFCHLSIDQAITHLAKLHPPLFLQEPFNQIYERLHFLQAIGIGYLSLSRSAPTLSGGETQRIRLSRQLASNLTGCLYVLDEPTIGLHPQDIAPLHKALLKLRDLGNTLILVEHDPLTMAISDLIIDFGPKAGKNGGEIVATGTLYEICNNPKSLTGSYLSGRLQIETPQKTRIPKTFLTIKNCNTHNLKNFTLSLPIGIFSCITGVSGSGKSTLLHDILKPFVEKNITSTPFKKLITIDQNPLGQSNRSDISTYTELLTPIRSLFASTTSAIAKGLLGKHFSFNHRSGMCISCTGLGKKTIDLQFLPSVKIVCDSCEGLRLNPLSLSIHYKGKNLGQILEMTVLEARQFFDAIPKIYKILDTLIGVGLDYVQLNQEIATLSGGEQQRIRLSRELSKKSSHNTLYLIDEPTIGLHSHDIVKLMTIFHRLVDLGNTLVIIEHNTDVIKNADYIFELGPKAGDEGGYLIAEGTPQEIRQNPASITGKYL
jgi:excinuclease ABC subunit A